MSYFNKAILANGLNEYAAKTCSWVLFGDNEYVESDRSSTLGFCENGIEDQTATTYAVPTELGVDNTTNLSLFNFRDINIAAITTAKTVSSVIGYNYGSTSKSLKVSSEPVFTSELKLHVDGTSTEASSTTNNSCFAFPGTSTNNFNNSGFTLRYIYLVIWNDVNAGSFPAKFGDIKGTYGQDIAGDKAYWNGTENNINKESYELFGNNNVELVLFGTGITENSGVKFNDYNYTTFSVGSLDITLQGLSS